LGESTDPEALRALLARYFERMRGIVESHGGTVEKFIGDAVMAVFGVPQAHEDDALRACRAAAEMRDALPELGVQARIGVSTGEVVTGTEERLATGDAVNVAARLEQAAQPGEVLLGGETMRLVGGAAEAEPVGPLALKGKREPVPAFRLVRVGEAPERLHGDVFVGRRRELEEVAAAWVRAGAERRCELVTIVAEAGVGKTRLAAAALDRLEARVVRGRCLSYGEGITYWPVVEVIKQLGARPSDPAAAAAIASLLGETGLGTSGEEIAWAFRKLLEEQAPLVCLFEDIHWGEETFLDLVEHVALLSAGAPLLLLCTARPELTERRHSWPVTLRLAPLEPGDVDELVPAALPSALREQIARAAGGNPLFVTEMVAMAETADGEVSVPPNLRALLAARLDQVDAAERRVLERGAVEGEIFHRGAVQALAPEEPQVTARLAGLVRRELVRPDRAQIPGEDGFRFRHVLIRDAAYQALPKSARADLHTRFADWLERHGAELVEVDEILGHHLEQAHRYGVELGAPDASLANRAGRLLAAAGLRAWSRSDVSATSSLLQRALALLSEHEPERSSLLVVLGWSHFRLANLPEALKVLRQAQTEAETTGQRGIELRARMVELLALLNADPEQDAVLVLAEARAAIRELERLGDPESLARAWIVVQWVGNTNATFKLLEEGSEGALGYATVAGLRAEAEIAATGLMWALASGPTPVEEAIPRAERVLAEHPEARQGEVALGLLFATAGEDDRAVTTIERARSILLERGDLGFHAAASMAVGWTALLADRPQRAEHELRAGVQLLEAGGDRAFLGTVAAVLADVLYRLGRYHEAEEWTKRSEQAAPADDVVTQVYWRATRAKVLARRRDHAEEALRLSAEAVEWARRSDAPQLLGDSLSDHAEALRLVGRFDEALPMLREALAVYEQKGIVPLIKRTQAQLEETPA
jgi:tetratricopeptide (TPR) repeat protein